MRTIRGLLLALAIAIFVAILYSWVSLLREHFAPTQVTATPTPEPSPSRAPLITGRLDTGRLFNGITVHSAVETPPGGDATTERLDPESYVLDLKLRARMPSANRTIEELAKVTPQLPSLLPELAAMVTPEPVSPFFAELY